MRTSMGKWAVTYVSSACICALWCRKNTVFLFYFYGMVHFAHSYYYYSFPGIFGGFIRVHSPGLYSSIPPWYWSTLLQRRPQVWTCRALQTQQSNSEISGLYLWECKYWIAVILALWVWGSNVAVYKQRIAISFFFLLICAAFASDKGVKRIFKKLVRHSFENACNCANSVVVKGSFQFV